ncbi:efflux transporter outer membrane subunit [Piscinibacter defluvii]|uniref:efflux transporter outer membrane subunit n=1 Tax=Piscinibacter defluvii TaxID=1796922 RepID=UPI000FDD74E0|nr:TolC family protein [Piscinibacter defluvii]
MHQVLPSAPSAPATAPWPTFAPAGAALVALTLLAGCAAPPTVTRPPTTGLPAAFGATPAPAAAFDEPWWRALGDAPLQALVAEAGERNLDWRIAVTRVEQARAGASAAASRLAPMLALNAGASDQRSGLPDEVKRGSPDTRALRASVDLGWELDLFGAARAARAAAAFDADAAAEGARAARLLAAAETARQYVVWQGARLRLAQVQELLRTQAETEGLTRSREAAGQASRFDVARAAAETRALAAQLPPLRTLVASTEHQIALLLGRPASAPLDALPRAQAAALPEVPALAPGQPAELLLRRPDLRAAERQLAAEDARLREARADRLPKFFLAALLGRQDLRLNGLDLSPVGYRNVALAFAWPLFDAGRLQAGEERAAARARGATLQLERTWLAALQEVESSLVALAEERERAAPLDALREERAAALRHAESLRREGQIDLLQLLDAQRGRIAAELAWTEHRTQLALNGLQLYRALGGGWSLDAPPATRVSEVRP